MYQTKVLFEPFPKQQEFIEAAFSDKYQILGYGGAVGGGKTFVCIATLLALHRLNPGSKSVVIRQSTPTLKKTTIPSFRKLVPPEYLHKFNNQDNIAHFNDGGEMLFMSEDISHDPDLDKFKGLEVNWAFLEQMEELSIDTLNMMLTRIGRNRIEPMPKGKIFYTVNPSPNWIYDYSYLRDKKGTLPPDHYYLRATIFDNPILSKDKDYLDQFKTLDKLTYRRYIEGDWDAFAGSNPFAHAFNEVKHCAQLEVINDEPIFISFDFNHSPVSCTIFQHDQQKTYIRCLYELGSTVGLGDLCRQINDLIGQDRQIFVTGDKSGWNRSELLEGNRTAYDIIQTELNLSRYAIQAPRQNPNLLKSRELVNGLFQNHPDLLIDAVHCPNLIFDLKFVEADERHQIVKNRNKREGKADYLDSFRYYLNTYHENFVRL